MEKEHLGAIIAEAVIHNKRELFEIEVFTDTKEEDLTPEFMLNKLRKEIGAFNFKNISFTKQTLINMAKDGTLLKEDGSKVSVEEAREMSKK